MNAASAQQNDTHAVDGDALVHTCHEMLNAAAALLANVEYLTNVAVGSNAERESAAADAANCIKRLSEQTRSIQDDARQTSRVTPIVRVLRDAPALAVR